VLANPRSSTRIGPTVKYLWNTYIYPRLCTISCSKLYVPWIHINWVRPYASFEHFTDLTSSLIKKRVIYCHFSVVKGLLTVFVRSSIGFTNSYEILCVYSGVLENSSVLCRWAASNDDYARLEGPWRLHIDGEGVKEHCCWKQSKKSLIGRFDHGDGSKIFHLKFSKCFAINIT